MQMRHFQLYELVDHTTYELMGEDAWELFRPDALLALDDFEDFFHRPVVVNNWHAGGDNEWRGRRTPAKAAELGAPNSRHVGDPASGKFCDAFDCTVVGVTADEARRMILANRSNPLLQRIMRLEANVTWVHFDLKYVPNRIYVFSA